MVALMIQSKRQAVMHLRILRAHVLRGTLGRAHRFQRLRPDQMLFRLCAGICGSAQLARISELHAVRRFQGFIGLIGRCRLWRKTSLKPEDLPAWSRLSGATGVGLRSHGAPESMMFAGSSVTIHRSVKGVGIFGVAASLRGVRAPSTNRGLAFGEGSWTEYRPRFLRASPVVTDSSGSP